jgi:LysM repeat protein
VVQRGDSPAGIAKKFKVSYVSLLKTNNIDDPKKLQIGQKLLIP